eukprot:732625-Rhodomonas_salina.1
MSREISRVESRHVTGRNQTQGTSLRAKTIGIGQGERGSALVTEHVTPSLSGSASCAMQSQTVTQKLANTFLVYLDDCTELARHGAPGLRLPPFTLAHRCVPTEHAFRLPVHAINCRARAAVQCLPPDHLRENATGTGSHAGGPGDDSEPWLSNLNLNVTGRCASPSPSR